MQNKTVKHQKIQNGIMQIYIFAMFVVFPFYNTDMYFSLLSDRTRFFKTATLLMVASLMIEWVRHTVILSEEDEKSFSLSLWIKSPRIVCEDLFLLLFLMIILISAWNSSWQEAAFDGSAGRLQGAELWMYYGLSFFCVSHFYNPSRNTLYFLLIPGILISIWGITDYLGLDIFGWLKEIKEGQRGSFSSSIGNINTYTGLIAIYLSVAGAYFIIAARNSGEKLILLFSFFISALALIMGRSDNAVIGIMAFFLFMPFMALGEAGRTIRFSFVLLLFGAAFPVTHFLDRYMHNPYVSNTDGILLRLSGKSFWLFLIMAGGILLALFCGYMKTVGEKQQRRNKLVRKKYYAIGWAGALVIAAIILCYMLYDANFGQGPDRYGNLGIYLKFSDTWGTHRGVCWRLAVESFLEFSPIQELIGTGPETFGIVMKKQHYKEMVNACGMIFDSPHNEFLQYLFCTGILGALTYYGFIVTSCIKGVRSNFIGQAAAAAILSYTAVSLVNISAPITVPFVIILAGCCASSFRLKNGKTKNQRS